MNEDSPHVAKVGDLNLPPKTTAAQDAVGIGQRKINVVWEYTQTFIAGSVVTVILFVAARIVISAIGPEATEKQASFANSAFIFLTGIANLVIGFYFGRTNHTRIGGVGEKEGHR